MSRRTVSSDTASWRVSSATLQEPVFSSARMMALYRAVLCTAFSTSLSGGRRTASDGPAPKRKPDRRQMSLIPEIDSGICGFLWPFS